MKPVLLKKRRAGFPPARRSETVYQLVGKAARGRGPNCPLKADSQGAEQSAAFSNKRLCRLFGGFGLFLPVIQPGKEPHQQGDHPENREDTPPWQ